MAFIDQQMYWEVLFSVEGKEYKVRVPTKSLKEGNFMKLVPPFKGLL